MTAATADEVVIIGAGPAGSLLATLLAESGHDVTVYEGRSDIRQSPAPAGRSINLTLADRGLAALRSVDLADRAAGLSMPLAGRMIHDDAGGLQFHPYGRRDGDVIRSISRTGLTAMLVDRAEATGRVRFEFGARLADVDLDRRILSFEGRAGATSQVGFEVLFGADGSNSVVRQALVDLGCTRVVRRPLDHGYKELRMSALAGGHRFDPGVLHLWPRRRFLLVAFANPDGSFTMSLFLANDGSRNSFEQLERADSIASFFESSFPDAFALIPDLVEQFQANPVGRLETVRTAGWSLDDRVCLVGDAAHTIVPFYGQGMNMSLESVVDLAIRLRSRPGDRQAVFAEFEREREPDANAIAELALDNYRNLRTAVLEADHRRQLWIARELERRYPDHFASEYNMVTFTTMPYADARARARAQREVLAEVTHASGAFDGVDIAEAGRLLAALGPLPASRGEAVLAKG